MEECITEQSTPVLRDEPLDGQNFQENIVFLFVILNYVFYFVERRLRVMFDVIDMAWDWPVVINYHEAKAYCAWLGQDYRLPSEAEHNVIRGTQVSNKTILI